MKFKHNKSEVKFSVLSEREVNELINSTILKPVASPEKPTHKPVFNKWDLPIVPRPYLRSKKNDPL